ncbi:MAG: tRNA lysidine(34) synthetase TilS [Eubacterium sp.]|nr:tRNA lysidine(34) synthetase TilS [Eubacterium sp.]
MLTIITDIDKTVKKYNMLSGGERVVIGISGGADSMLLLNYFMAVRKKYALDICVANVEHGIRGDASKKDSEFVERFCRDNSIEFHMLSINAPKEAKNAGEGVEEYSRKRRYEFFNSLSPDKIAVAHNSSDNAETFLFRLSRGMGINGACAVKPVRDNIIRPLIELSSEDIREYCNKNNIQYVIDETNNHNDYSRNYIRNVIIPEFEKLNPSFEESVLRFVESISEAQSHISRLGKECYNKAFNGEGLDVSVLKEADEVIAKEAIKLYFESRGINLDALHLNKTYSLIFTPSRVQLKGCVYAVSNKSTLRCAEFTGEKASFKLDIKTVSKDEFDKNSSIIKKEFAFYLDCDKIVGKLSVGERNEGDSIKPQGRGVTKSLKKLFNELEYPAEKRDSVPVLRDENGVIGVGNICMDERVRIDGNTNNVMIIRVEDNI